MSNLVANFGLATAPNAIFQGTQPNDAVLYTTSSNNAIWIGCGVNTSNSTACISSTGFAVNTMVASNLTTSNLSYGAISLYSGAASVSLNAGPANQGFTSITSTYLNNTQDASIGGTLTLCNLNLTGSVTGFNGVSSNQSFSNVWSSNVYSSNATFSNINFTGQLTQNGVAFSGGGGSTTSATFSNLTVTQTLTLGSNTIGFGSGSAATITASTWNYLQNYVFTATGSNFGPAINSTLMTGVASQHSAFVQGGQVYVYGNNSNGQLGLGSTTPATIPTLLPGISNATAVACGQQFTVILANSNVYTMGNNSFGQLGYNTSNNDQLTPVLVPGLSNIVQINAGVSHALYLGSNNTLWGTGCGTQGQLATNTATVNSNPVSIALPYNAAPGTSNAVLTIDCGAYHSAMVLNNGTIYTWGQNTYGQLANSNLAAAATTIVTSPQPIANFPGTVSLACGMFHTVWANSNGSVYAAGRNDYGQCGNGATSATLTTPAKIVNGDATKSNLVSLLAAGRGHTGLIKSDGTIWTWGDNTYGQLGQGATVSQITTPTQLLMQYATTATAYSVAAGQYNTTFLLNNDPTVPQKNRIVSCGQNNYGQVGNAMYSPTGIAASSNVYVPVPITPSTTLYRKQLMNGGSLTSTSSYVDTDGTLYMWGYNGDYECGDGSTTNRLVPSPVSALNFPNGTRIVQVAHGGSHTLALDSAGQVWAWGYNTAGQIGNNTTTIQVTPITISSFGALNGKTIVAISAASHHSVALDNNGNLYTWGLNNSGQLGNNSQTNSSVPIAISSFGAINGKTIVSISAGSHYTVALDNNGATYVWGSNNAGQFGNNTTTNSYIPIAISSFGSLNGKTIVAIAAGSLHILALDSSGNVYAWGYNGSGQLGNNTTTNSYIPIAISSFGSLNGKTIVAVAGNAHSSVALDSSGNVYAWGYNGNGQLGNNTTTNSYIPIAISSFGAIKGKTIVAIAEGYIQTFALDSTGNVYAWGNNTSGELGINTTTNASIPTLVTLNNRQVYQSMFSQGGLGDHKLLRSPHGAIGSNVLQVVGNNANGQLGNGTTTNQSTILTLPTNTFPAGTSIVAHSTGLSHSGVVLNTGATYLWGNNASGQCGVAGGGNVLTPTVFSSTPAATGIALGSNCSFIISNGNVAALGLNTSNQLGLNSATASFSNAQIMNFPSSIASIASGGGSSLALSLTGQVYSWGTNALGATGQGTTAGTTTTPTLVNPAPWNNFPATQVAMGDGIAAVVANGALFTCGINTEGGCGLAANFGTATPISTFSHVVFGQTNYVVSVACGQRHMIVQLANNSIVTFGRNTAGQLGGVYPGMGYFAGSNQYQPSLPIYNITNPPTAVSASANSSLEEHFDNTTKYYGNAVGTTKLMVGGSQDSKSFIVTPSGNVYGWGNDYYGGIGNNSTSTVQTPINVSAFGAISGKNIAQIASGNGFSIAIDTTGQVYAWGLNGFGQLGNNNPGTDSRTPVAISNNGALFAKKIIAVAAGGIHTIALDSNGKVYSWGYNSYSQLGNGNTTNQSIAIDISNNGSLYNKMIIAIAAGNYHNMALDSTGQVHAWGQNTFGKLGNNTQTNSSFPIAISSFGAISDKTIVAIAAATDHSIALDSNGQVYAWGYNGSGQLGNNTTTNSSIPIAISSFGAISGKTIVAIAAGYSHSIALDSNGKVYAWGWNGFGQLGNNSTTESSVPQAISSFGAIAGKNIVAISAGSFHTMALDDTGNVYAWGANRNSSYELGNSDFGLQATTPQLLTGSSGITFPLSLTAPVAVSFTPFFVNFTGQHRVFVAGETTNSLGAKEGFIVVCDQNDYITAPGKAPLGQFSRGKDAITMNDAMPIVSLAKKAYDKRVFGVLSSVVEPLSPEMATPDAQGQQQLVNCGDVRMEVNAIGEGAIWVSDANGPLQSGDLITSSSIPGYGQLQTGDLPNVFASYTVAKITCDCDFDAGATRPKMVIQKDENGLNVIDPVTGWPVWIQETTTVLIDPATGLVADKRQSLENPEEFQAWFSSLLATQEPVVEPLYKMRYLLADGTEIQKEEYDANVASGVACFRAAFVGCTYHCG